MSARLLLYTLCISYTDSILVLCMTFKLFGELWRQGTILVATSNRPPGNLYQGGLNRSYFLPFIEELEYRCIVRHLKSPIDYRTLLSSKLAGAYLTPVNAETTRELRAMFLADDTSAKGVVYGSFIVISSRVT
jgi:predicted ATPase